MLLNSARPTLKEHFQYKGLGSLVSAFFYWDFLEIFISLLSECSVFIAACSYLKRNVPSNILKMPAIILLLIIAYFLLHISIILYSHFDLFFPEICFQHICSYEWWSQLIIVSSGVDFFRSLLKCFQNRLFQKQGQQVPYKESSGEL